MYFSKPSIEGLSSYAVSKKEIQTHQCFTILDVRRSIDENLCDIALKNLKNDMAHRLYENGCDVLPSTENKVSGNWVALAMPDAIPSRLGLITRISSLMVVYDAAEYPAAPVTTNNKFESRFASDLEQALPDLSSTHQASTRHTTKTPGATIRSKAAQTLIRSLIQDLLSTDSAKGLEVFQAWHRYHHDVALTPSNFEVVTSLDDYLQTCDIRFPSQPWLALLRYALGLHLHDHELESTQPAIEAAMQSVALTRDYWAWPKVSCGANNNKRVANAVAVLMTEHCCQEAEAMKLVRDAAVAAEDKFLENKADVVEKLVEGQSEVVMFLEAVEQFAAGNSLWCSSCPRFRGRR